MEKIKKHELSSNNWIVKSNALNEMRNNRMTISQIRLFSIYLSKINPLDESSRVVTFKLEEYTKIMQFKRANTTRLMETAEKLIGLTFTFMDKDGKWTKDGLRGFVMCSIFKYFRLYQSEGEWFVSIDCHDDVLKLMFDLKGYYFKYQLWNALQLTSPNQQRMYEILKQYEYAGAREINVKDLREFLGLEPEEHKRWDNFRRRVLEASQEALANYTDIKFTWEVAGKRGKGGKINKLKFNIEKNENYVRQITFDEYLIEQTETVIEDEPEEFVRPDDEVAAAAQELQEDEDEDGYFARETYPLLDDACKGEFTMAEIQVLYNIIIKIIPYKGGKIGVEGYKLEVFDYLKRRYDELNWRAGRTEIKSRFGYLKKIIEADLTVLRDGE